MLEAVGFGNWCDGTGLTDGDTDARLDGMT